VFVRFRRSAIAAVPVVLLAGACAGLMLTGTAQARPSGPDRPAVTSAASRPQNEQCQSRPGGPARCAFAQEIQLPMSVSVTTDAVEPGQSASVSWTISCSVNGVDIASSTGDKTGTSPFTTPLSLPKSSSGDCTVNVTIALVGSGGLTATLNYSLAHQMTIWVPVSNPAPGAPLAILKCVTAAGNKAGSKAVLGNCPSTYSTAWVYSGTRLLHHGLCLTDPGNGGAWTRLVLEKCTGAADQAWSFTKGQTGYTQAVIKGRHLCLDDPNYTKTAGTPLIVSGCNGGDAQRWTFS
jgi:Ricin-type beta-trefoil lectin domain